jgi:hypothetical protein
MPNWLNPRFYTIKWRTRHMVRAATLCDGLSPSVHGSLGVLPGAPGQPFRASTSVLPSRAGDGDTLMPAASMAAIFESASPLPPEMMAPA